MMNMLKCLSLGVAVAGVVTVGSVIAETLYQGTFDSGRFGDPVAGGVQSTFDSGRFGDPVVDTVTTGGIQAPVTKVTTQAVAAPVKDTIIVIRGDDGKYTAETSALGVDVTNTPEGKAAILEAANGAGEGMTAAELNGTTPAKATTPGGKTVGEEAAADKAAASKDAKSKELCGMSSGDATKMAGSESAMKAQMAANGGQGMDSASAACMKSLKEGLQACAKGDKAAFDQSLAKSEKECPKVDLTGAAVNTPTPVAMTPEAVVESAGAALQAQVQQAQSMLGNMLGGNLQGSMQAIVGVVAQQMVTKLMDQLTGGGSDDGSSSGDDGSNVVEKDDTCDRVTSTKNASQTEVVSAVTVTTVLVIDSCANGNLRTRSTVTMQYPNGTSETKHSEAIQ